MKTKNVPPQNGEARGSWRTLLRFYRKVKIPWGMLLLVFVSSFAVKEAQSRLVPYTSAIMIAYATYENYQELFRGGFVVVDFFSKTCGPCKILAKILEELVCELPFVNIVKVNCTTHPKLGAENQIDAVPTIFFVKDGELKERVVGLIDRDEITEKISAYYYG